MLKLSLIPAYSALPCPMFEILRNSVILFYLGLTSHIYVYVCVHVCELELHSLTGSLSLCLSVSLSQRSCHTCTFTHILLQAHTYTHIHSHHFVKPRSLIHLMRDMLCSHPSLTLSSPVAQQVLIPHLL